MCNVLKLIMHDVYYEMNNIDLISWLYLIEHISDRQVNITY